MFALRGWGIHLCEVMKAGVVLVLNLNLKKNCLKGCEASEFHHLSLALQVLHSQYSGEDLKTADWGVSPPGFRSSVRLKVFWSSDFNCYF